MTHDQFWSIIDRVHVTSAGEMDEKCELLRDELEQLTDLDLRDFVDHFNDADLRAYTWKLWAAAYLIGGGCSDDAFSDFRATLISMGRGFYERALTDPDRLASTNFDEESAFYEGFQYVKNDLAQERWDEIPRRKTALPDEPGGEPWEEDPAVLARLLPRLAAKFP